MNGEDYVSLTDAISLGNWLMEIYDLPSSTFKGVDLKELADLASEILGGNAQKNSSQIV